MIVEIDSNNKTFEYDVDIAYSEEERIKGLQDTDKLDENKGLLFIYDNPQTVRFWNKGVKYDISIIFISEKEEVISIYQAKANDETIVEEDNVKYVLEINPNYDIKEGDEIDIDDVDDIDEDEIKMYILNEKGNIQGEIEEGSRIFSRPNTKTIIRMSKKANKSKKDTDYARLGKKVFKFLDIQDNRKPDYVQIPN